MSDFDDVLERLLTDPTFQARLAADPRGALAGYHLDAEERDLLGAHLVGGDEQDRTVELRTSKSGVVGMIGPVLSALGMAAGGGPGTGGPVESLGSAPTDGHGGFGPGGGHGPGAGPIETLGAAPQHHVTESLGSSPVESMGEAPPPSPGDHQVAADYHTRVDADGDGRMGPPHRLRAAGRRSGHRGRYEPRRKGRLRRPRR